MLLLLIFSSTGYFFLNSGKKYQYGGDFSNEVPEIKEENTVTEQAEQETKKYGFEENSPTDVTPFDLESGETHLPSKSDEYEKDEIVTEKLESVKVTDKPESGEEKQRDTSETDESELATETPPDNSEEDLKKSETNDETSTNENAEPSDATDAIIVESHDFPYDAPIPDSFLDSSESVPAVSSRDSLEENDDSVKKFIPGMSLNEIFSKNLEDKKSPESIDLEEDIEPVALDVDKTEPLAEKKFGSNDEGEYPKTVTADQYIQTMDKKITPTDDLDSITELQGIDEKFLDLAKKNIRNVKNYGYDFVNVSELDGEVMNALIEISNRGRVNYDTIEVVNYLLKKKQIIDERMKYVATIYGQSSDKNNLLFFVNELANVKASSNLEETMENKSNDAEETEDVLNTTENETRISEVNATPEVSSFDEAEETSNIEMENHAEPLLYDASIQDVQKQSSDEEYVNVDVDDSEFLDEDY